MMARKRWRQSQLAAKLGVSEVWVSRRLTGKTEISLEDLRLFADGFDVEPAALLPSGGRSTTAQYVTEPQVRPHLPTITSPRGIRSRARLTGVAA